MQFKMTTEGNFSIKLLKLDVHHLLTLGRDRRSTRWCQHSLVCRVVPPKWAYPCHGFLPV